MQNYKNSKSEQITFLMSALDEAESSVRAFDTKAQIVGIGYIFAIGIISTISSWNPEKTPFIFSTILITWSCVMVPIIIFGSVLYPSRKMAPRLGEKSSHVKRLYHVSIEYIKKVDTYISDIGNCDITAELSYELMKVSALRELKRIRFIRALFFSCLSFIIIFTFQVMRSIGIDFV